MYLPRSDVLSIRYEIAFRWMPQDLIGDYLALAQVMDWYCLNLKTLGCGIVLGNMKYMVYKRKLIMDILRQHIPF